MDYSVKVITQSRPWLALKPDQPNREEQGNIITVSPSTPRVIDLQDVGITYLSLLYVYSTQDVPITVTVSRIVNGTPTVIHQWTNTIVAFGSYAVPTNPPVENLRVTLTSTTTAEEVEVLLQGV